MTPVLTRLGLTILVAWSAASMPLAAWAQPAAPPEQGTGASEAAAPTEPQGVEGTGLQPVYVVVPLGTQAGDIELVEPALVGTALPAGTSVVVLPAVGVETQPVQILPGNELPPGQIPPVEVLLPAQAAAGDGLLPPANVQAMDTPGDYGGSITVSWTPSPDEASGRFGDILYQVAVTEDGSGCAAAEGAGETPAESPATGETGTVEAPGQAGPTWSPLADVPAGENQTLFTKAVRACTYRFKVVAAAVRPAVEAALLDAPASVDLVLSEAVESNPVAAVDDLLPLPALTSGGDPPGAPVDVVVEDKPWDEGGVLLVSFGASEEDGTEDGFVGYDILTATDPEGFWTIASHVTTRDPVAFTAPVAQGEGASQGRGSYKVAVENLELHIPYNVRVVAISDGGRASSEPSGAVVAGAAWFDGSLFATLIIGLILCAFVLYYIQMSRKGKKPFIRKIAGLEAIDEAIGRATEMGRPILFVPGISDMDNVQTLAALTILGHVSKTIAEYDTKIDVPCCRSLVMTAAREVVKQAYLEAGRPDAYNENSCHYLTDDQFGYVAGVNGICVRDQPATCFFQGGFYAESLILAETGNSIGAIQIAGTAMTSQLPFFVAACDYTLIGEELFAASAYLSGDPRQMGSLKGSDMGKALSMIAVAAGALAATLISISVAIWGTEGTVSNWFGGLMDLLLQVFP